MMIFSFHRKSGHIIIQFLNLCSAHLYLIGFLSVQTQKTVHKQRLNGIFKNLLLLFFSPPWDLMEIKSNLFPGMNLLVFFALVITASAEHLIPKKSVAIDKNSVLVLFGTRHGNRHPEVFLQENPRSWGHEGNTELTSVSGQLVIIGQLRN